MPFIPIWIEYVTAVPAGIVSIIGGNAQTIANANDVNPSPPLLVPTPVNWNTRITVPFLNTLKYILS